MLASDAASHVIEQIENELSEDFDIAKSGGNTYLHADDVQIHVICGRYAWTLRVVATNPVLLPEERVEQIGSGDIGEADEVRERAIELFNQLR